MTFIKDVCFCKNGATQLHNKTGHTTTSFFVNVFVATDRTWTQRFTCRTRAKAQTAFRGELTVKRKLSKAGPGESSLCRSIACVNAS